MTTKLFNVTRLPYQFTKHITYCGFMNRNVCVQHHGSGDYVLKNQSIQRNLSTDKRPDTAVSGPRADSDISVSVKEAVKETTKTVSYLGVIVMGIGVTSIMFYTIFSELFSNKSPNSVYTKTLKRCCEDNRVKDALGEPIKGFGELTSRGRRRHTKHLAYEIDGIGYLRMQFYLKGARKQGTVHLEMKEDANKNFKYRYLFVELDDYTRRIIVLEDNRSETAVPLSPPIDQIDISSPLNLS